MADANVAQLNPQSGGDMTDAQQKIIQYKAQQQQQNVANGDPEAIWKNQYANYMNANQGGLPTQPGYQGFTGSDGKIDPRFQLNAQPDIGFKSNLGDLNSRLSGINVDKTGLNELRNRATSTGPSAWAQLMLQNQGLQQQTAQDNLSKSGNAAAESARAAMGVHGGMSAGARERLATNSMYDMTSNNQALARSGEQARLGINTQDQSNQLDLLKSLPGAEVNAVQPELAKANLWSGMAGNENAMQQSLALANRNYSTDVQKENLGTAKADIMGRNQYAQDKWKVDADAWKAMMQAGAQQYG